MKYIVISLFVALFGLQQTKAQTTDQISFGEVEHDGYFAAKKGANWSKRPEAKKVYYGEIPPGVTVYILDQDYLGRFSKAKGEHNPLDINYFIIPKGEKVYKKGDSVFAAICGNWLIYLKPLIQIKFIPATPQCENRYHVTIYRVADEFGRLLMQDSVISDGFPSKDCRNLVDTTIYIEMWKKQIVYADDEMPNEKPAKQKDEVVNNTTTNNYYTTNIYGAQRGGSRPIYRQQEVRRGGFIFLGFRGGGGNISTPVPIINPRYDPGGLGGGGTRWDPPGNGGRGNRFDPAGIGG